MTRMTVVSPEPKTVPAPDAAPVTPTEATTTPTCAYHHPHERCAEQALETFGTAVRLLTQQLLQCDVAPSSNKEVACSALTILQQHPDLMALHNAVSMIQQRAVLINDEATALVDEVAAARQESQKLQALLDEQESKLRAIRSQKYVLTRRTKSLSRDKKVLKQAYKALQTQAKVESYVVSALHTHEQQLLNRSRTSTSSVTEDSTDCGYVGDDAGDENDDDELLLRRRYHHHGEAGAATTTTVSTSHPLATTVKVAGLKFSTSLSRGDGAVNGVAPKSTPQTPTAVVHTPYQPVRIELHESAGTSLSFKKGPKLLHLDSPTTEEASSDGSSNESSCSVDLSLSSPPRLSLIGGSLEADAALRSLAIPVMHPHSQQRLYEA